jgi:hypothetical protein
MTPNNEATLFCYVLDDVMWLTLPASADTEADMSSRILPSDTYRGVSKPQYHAPRAPHQGMPGRPKEKERTGHAVKHELFFKQFLFTANYTKGHVYIWSQTSVCINILLKKQQQQQNTHTKKNKQNKQTNKRSWTSKQADNTHYHKNSCTKAENTDWNISADIYQPTEKRNTR